MGVSNPDITKALLAELTSLVERQAQFQTRVKAADKAARARDDDARKQNEITTQRIVALENELKQAKDSIGALQRFVELLPSVKRGFNSFEDEVDAFEALGSDYSTLEQAVSVTARVDALAGDIPEVIKLITPSASDFSDILDRLSISSNDLSVFGEPLHGRAATGWAAGIDFNFDPTLKNGARLDLISEFMNLPLRNGDLRFLIPETWFDEWKKDCKRNPDGTETQVGPIQTSTLVSRYGHLVQAKTPGSEVLYTGKSGSDFRTLQKEPQKEPQKEMPKAASWETMMPVPLPASMPDVAKVPPKGTKKAKAKAMEALAKEVKALAKEAKEAKAKEAKATSAPIAALTPAITKAASNLAMATSQGPLKVVPSRALDAENGGAAVREQAKDVPLSAWRLFVKWYGCDSVQFPRLVMPQGLHGIPGVDYRPRVHNLYFILPPGGSPRGEYTPQVVIPQNCLIKTLRSIIISSFPTFANPSVEFFSTEYNVATSPRGCYVLQRPDMVAVLLGWESELTLEQVSRITNSSSFCVSVKVLDETTGCMIPVDPFPPPACPPKVLTWSHSCA